jgi:hypothetical protein
MRCGSSSSSKNPGRERSQKESTGICIRIYLPFWNLCNNWLRVRAGGKFGVVSIRPENYVLSIFTEIAYRLIPQELVPNLQYLRNSFARRGLQKLRT